MKTYCIVATTELDGEFVFHREFEHEPSREEILVEVAKEDFGYEDNYGKLRFWEISTRSK